MPVSKTKTALIGLGVSFLLSPLCATTAMAECANHPGQARPRVCDEFYYSDAVFEGTVVSTRQVPTAPADPANIMGWVYTLEINKAYRGLEQRTVEIYAGNDTSGVPLQHGHTYILFVKKNPQGYLAPNSCGSTSEMSKANETMAFLKKLMEDRKTSNRGEIGGRVFAVAAGEISLSDQPAPGIKVIAHAGDKTFQDITDAKGQFHIGVPVGKYTVTTESNAWTVTPYALSYAKPDNIVIENAGCADLDMLAVPKAK